MHSPDDFPDDLDDLDRHDTQRRRRPRSFRERHALKILGTIMVVMFATVVLVQVAC